MLVTRLGGSIGQQNFGPGGRGGGGGRGLRAFPNRIVILVHSSMEMEAAWDQDNLLGVTGRLHRWGGLDGGLRASDDWAFGLAVSTCWCRVFGG
jgi:hypothetical protein